MIAEDIKKVKCKDGEVQLDVMDSKIKEKVDKTFCFTKDDYKAAKENLKAEREKNLREKGYEFDLRDKELAGAVLNEEVKRKGGMVFPAGATKEEIKSELLKLLDN